MSISDSSNENSTLLLGLCAPQIIRSVGRAIILTITNTFSCQKILRGPTQSTFAVSLFDLIDNLIFFRQSCNISVAVFRQNIFYEQHWHVLFEVCSGVEQNEGVNWIVQRFVGRLPYRPLASSDRSAILWFCLCCKGQKGKGLQLQLHWRRNGRRILVSCIMMSCSQIRVVLTQGRAQPFGTYM